MQEFLPLPSEDESESSGHSFTYSVLLPLARSRWIVLGCALAGATIGVGRALLKPNEYRSSGSLLVRLGEEERSASRDLIASDRGGSRALTSQDINSEVSLLDSSETYRKVVEDLGIDRVLAPYDPTRLDDDRTAAWVRALHALQAWYAARESDHLRVGEPRTEIPPHIMQVAIDTLRDNTDIRAQQYATSIDIEYRSHDPSLAQEVVASLLESCLERHNEVFSSEPKLAALSQAFERSKRDWERLRSALSTFRKEFGVHDADVEKRALIARRVELEAEQATIGRTIAGLRDALQYLDTSLENLPPTVRTLSPPQRAVNPEWTVLNSRLREQEERLEELQGFAETTPEVRDQRRRIQETAEKIAKVDQFVIVDGVWHEAANPQREAAFARRATLREELAKFSAEADEIERDLADTTSRLEHIEECVPELSRLITEERVAHAQHEALLTQLERGRREAQVLDEKGQSNLLISRSASFQSDKIGPRRTKSLAFGLIAGLMLGVVAALARWHLDRSYRHAEQIERDLGIPVICVVDDDPAWTEILDQNRVSP